jgi:phage terminase large subunit-like protein
MLPTSRYDKKKADRAVTFIENLCHTKGKWAGTPFWLLPWQEQLIRDIFGIVKPDGNRQFRTAFVEICKKVGKSELAAADRQQASIVFDVAKQMVEMSPALMKRSKLMGASKRIVNSANCFWLYPFVSIHFFNRLFQVCSLFLVKSFIILKPPFVNKNKSCSNITYGID